LRPIVPRHATSLRAGRASTHVKRSPWGLDHFLWRDGPLASRSRAPTSVASRRTASTGRVGPGDGGKTRVGRWCLSLLVRRCPQHCLQAQHEEFGQHVVPLFWLSKDFSVGSTLEGSHSHNGSRYGRNALVVPGRITRASSQAAQVSLILPTGSAVATSVTRSAPRADTGPPSKSFFRKLLKARNNV